MAKFASPHMITLIALPCALAVLGYISVGISQTVASQPIPKIAVATKRVILPGISTARSGRLGTFCARPPKMVSIPKQVDRPIAPRTMSLRRPTTSIDSHAKVIIKK